MVTVGPAVWVQLKVRLLLSTSEALAVSVTVLEPDEVAVTVGGSLTGVTSMRKLSMADICGSSSLVIVIVTAIEPLKSVSGVISNIAPDDILLSSPTVPESALTVMVLFAEGEV